MWEAWCIFKLIANIWRNRAPHKPGHFVAESFQRLFFLFFSFFFNFLSPRPAFLVCRPLSVPHIPLSCLLYSKLWPEHWPWTLTSPVISHIPGPFPPLRPQTAHHSSPPPFPASSSCSLFVPRHFFFFFFLSLSLNPEWQSWLLMGCCSETTESKHSLSSWTTDPKPHCQLSPRSTALSVNLWNDLELLSKWWCQPVRMGQLSSGAPMRQANSPNLGHTPPVCFFPSHMFGSLVRCCL